MTKGADSPPVTCRRFRGSTRLRGAPRSGAGSPGPEPGRGEVLVRVRGFRPNHPGGERIRVRLHCTRLFPATFPSDRQRPFSRVVAEVRAGPCPRGRLGYEVDRAFVDTRPSHAELVVVAPLEHLVRRELGLSVGGGWAPCFVRRDRTAHRRRWHAVDRRGPGRHRRRAARRWGGPR